MRRFSSSVILLLVFSVPVAQAQVRSRTPAVGAQPPVITVTLGTDQTGIVRTAQGITTRIAFPEKVTESICGDLYDPASGRGTFVVQISGSDVFLKPVASKGMSNLFVMTGEGGKRQIYHFDVNVVSAAQAHRIVNVVAAAPAQPPAPAAAQPMLSETPSEAGVLSMKEPPKQIKPASSNSPVFTTGAVTDAGAGAAGEVPGGLVGGTGPAEPPPEKTSPKKEEPTPKSPNIIRRSGGVLSGEAIRKAEPPYPPRAKAARVSGAVVVEVTVDESGNVIAARAISGHPLLNDAAVSAALGWKFNATKVTGQPVKVTRTITFNFSL